MKVIVAGKASGKILKTSNPINFLGTVDKKPVKYMIQNTICMTFH